MAFPTMKNSAEFVEHVREMMAGVPHLAVKPMFGGHGVFREGLMFGCLARDELYLRASGELAEAMLASGSEQFSVEMRGKPFAMPYFSVPTEALENPDLMSAMAASSFDDALAADSKKSPSKRKHKPVG